jgi:23S rRNA (adenine2503-C2)-methyltransferase
MGVNQSQHLKDHCLESLRDRFSQLGVPSYRANQVSEWLYRHGVDDPDHMTNLSEELREWLVREWQSRAVEVAGDQVSQDGTRKLAMRTRDDALIETVMIPEARRKTLCISTQVGCPLACSFCATGDMGFTRNLTTAEIVDQVCRTDELLGEGESITNVVFMGMGEPLLNLPAVSEAIRILIDPRGLALAPRRITVSTSGLVPKIAELLEIAPINLAVSLHATRDEVRDVLVPLNKRFPLAELLGALRRDPNVNRRRPVFFEYTLLEGMNDSLEYARDLPCLLRGIPCKVNLIPANPYPGARWPAPSQEVMDRFAAEVYRGGLRVTLRRSRGSDIDAACGQLANAERNLASTSVHSD